MNYISANTCALLTMSKARRGQVGRISIPRKADVAELSTGHLTQSDVELLEKGAVPGQIGKYEYGFVVRTSVHKQAHDLLAWGMSQAYVDLLHLLHRHKFHYLFLDQDAERVNGIPVFDWQATALKESQLS